MRPVQVIFNPRANRGGDSHTADAIRRALDQAGLPYDLRETEHAGHATELAQQACRDEYEIVAAAGGDGTISEVVNGLLRCVDEADAANGAPGANGDGVHKRPAAKLAVLPCGSGNDFASVLGHPFDLSRAVQVIAAGRTRLIDVGYLTLRTAESEITRYFDNNVGFGLEAQVTVESTKISRLSGIWLYVAAALRALMRYRLTHVEVEWETPDGGHDTVTGDLMLVSIGNSARVGGGFYITPDAVMDDGFFDVGIAGAISKLRALWLLPKALSGAHTDEPAFQVVRSARVHIRCPAGRPVQVDGEVVAERAEELTVALHPKRLAVIV